MAIQDLIKSCLSKSSTRLNMSHFSSHKARPLAIIGVVPMAIAVLLVSNAATAKDTSRSTKIDRPVIGLSPTQVCSGISYYDFEGNPLEGKLHCGYDTCAKDGATGCLATQDFPAANIANINGNDLKKDQAIAGIAGALKICDKDKEVGCVANAAFTAAEMVKVTTGNIKKGETIAGVTGAYPSESFPLPGKGTSNRVLNSGNFVASITQTDDSIEFWDHKGVRHAGSTTAKIIPENIKDKIKIFGVTGTFKQHSTFNAADLRAGIQIGAVTGTLKADCRNSSKTSTTDPYSTVDDNTLPALKPFGEDHHCAENVWLDKTNINGQRCDQSALLHQCMWQNTVTKAYWAGDKTIAVNNSAQNAKNYCTGYSVGGLTSGWRVPTQKELMAAYAQGAVWMAGDNTSPKGYHSLYWSSTAVSNNTSRRYVVNMRTGEVSTNLATTSANMGTICVHD